MVAAVFFTLQAGEACQVSTYSAVWNHGDVPNFPVIRFLTVGLLCSVCVLAQLPFYTGRMTTDIHSNAF